MRRDGGVLSFASLGVLSSLLRFFLRAGAAKVQERGTADDGPRVDANGREFVCVVPTKTSGGPASVAIGPTSGVFGPCEEDQGPKE